MIELLDLLTPPATEAPSHSYTIGKPGKKPRKEKPCDCPRCNPQPGQDPDPRYGYDRNAVPAVKCHYCDMPIGAEPYVEIRIFARFGSMSFAHARCDKEAKQ